MKTRRLIFCVIIPAVSSFLAGAFFTLHGVSNVGIVILLAIIALCAGWAYYVKGSGLAYNVVGWLPEVFTGYLYIKVLAGLINNEFGPMTFMFVLALFVIMVVFTIKYGNEIMKIAGIKRRRRKNVGATDNSNNLSQQEQTPQEQNLPEDEQNTN